MPGPRDERGQATVELALCLPLLAVVCAGLVETTMVAVDQVRVWHAAREAVRTSAVDPDPAAVRAAAASSGLARPRVAIEPAADERSPGRATTVVVTYPYDGRVPLLGALFERVVLRAEATMRIERP